MSPVRWSSRRPNSGRRGQRRDRFERLAWKRDLVLQHRTETQFGRGADEVDGSILRSSTPGSCTKDVAALAPDLGFGDAQAVDAAADDLYGPVEHVVGTSVDGRSTTEMPPCRSSPYCGLLPAMRVAKSDPRQITTKQMSGTRLRRTGGVGGFYETANIRRTKRREPT